MKDSWNWEIEDLEALINQNESIRLEFKRSELLISKSRDEIARDLSKAASAFANTVGGNIVIGLKEEKIGKTRVAKGLDEGTPLSVISPEQLLSVVETNINPLLPGIRLRSICVGASGNRYYVIHIPQGSTAYQAQDHKYYGRSEFNSKSLSDNEIRLRMFRAKAYQARIRLLNIEVSPEEIDKENLQKRLGDVAKRILAYYPEPENISKFALKKYSYDVVLENTGEINISEFKVKMAFSNTDLAYRKTFERVYRDGAYNDSIMKKMFSSLTKRTLPEYPENIVVFPHDTFSLTAETFYHPADSAIQIPENTLSWKLFLPDSLPNEGNINITEEISLVCGCLP